MVEDTNNNRKEVLQENKNEKSFDTLENQIDETQSGSNANRKSTGFFASLLSVAIDGVVLLGVSTALMFILDFIIKFFGYQVSDRISMLFVLFVISNLIYTAVMESSKFAGTLGKLVLNLKVYRLK